MTAPESAATDAPDAASSGNGQHDTPAPRPEREAHEPPAPESGLESQPASAEPAAREFHAEPRESGGTHEAGPIAHFEPSPRPEAGSAPNKPYVVWSSSPSQKEGGGRGPEE